MKNKVLVFGVLVFFLFSLAGCYDAHSIESSYYIVAIGIDKGKNSLYNLSIQIAQNENSTSNPSTQSSNSTIYQVECDTFDLRNKHIKQLFK